ncbi:MAG: fibronectin type III domain-containing protein [Thermoplasmatales archaeon]|nr:fibronectin type III domain-containing protein [Thermoplasmatales archaeon]
MKKEIMAFGICALLLLIVFSSGCIDFGGEEKKKDATPPTISGVRVSDVTDSTATILWATNKLSSSVVEYGTTTSSSYGLTATGSDDVIVHSVALSGLSASTTYQYRVKSTDSSGNTRTSLNNTFRTTLPTIVLRSPPYKTSDNVNATCILSCSAGGVEIEHGVLQWALFDGNVTAGTLQRSGIFYSPVTSIPTAGNITDVDVDWVDIDGDCRLSAGDLIIINENAWEKNIQSGWTFNIIYAHTQEMIASTVYE